MPIATAINPRSSTAHQLRASSALICSDTSAPLDCCSFADVAMVSSQSPMIENRQTPLLVQYCVPPPHWKPPSPLVGEGCGGLANVVSLAEAGWGVTRHERGSMNR